MKASLRRQRGGHGECPCCSADIVVDSRQRFGILLCPSCDRVVWWWIPSDQEAPYLSSDVHHDLLKDLGAVSFDMVKLVMLLEEELGMEIPDADASKLESVEDVMDYIEKHKKITK